MTYCNRKSSVVQRITVYWVGNHPNPRLRLETLLGAFQDIDALCAGLDELFPSY